ncbi:hypothetical protein [Thiovibrio frasassiensis]|uniref:Uncharacterized protein n=1 Tax=Thiovibrio frasassiensis TaxID=2984131 RepID=A0A9X4MHT3_9BACT|nr:hypothetical protein [Thiovibrio frasassiensis]MDG4475798.1 hypothetical protein [Thiovibrio frasassiensis]
MKYRIGPWVQRISAASLLVLAATPSWSEEVASQGTKQGTLWVAPADWFVYLVIFIVLIGTLLAMALLRAALTLSSWSLADALSEEVEVTAMEKDAAGASKVVLDASGKPLMITELRASSSRMVALMGMIAILLMFLGFGAFALFVFAKTGSMPESIEQVVNYLLAGLTLFAPYVVNKFSSIFESLAPKKS